MTYLHLQKPKNFIPKFEVVSCICWYRDKILCLQRNTEKIEGNKWGFPAGKIEDGEKLNLALKREFKEELQLKLDNLKYKKLFFLRYPEIDFLFHLFESRFTNIPEIKINQSENQKFEWKSLDEFLKLPTVRGNSEIIKFLYLNNRH